jgi:SAM-dependent methyltransferase
MDQRDVARVAHHWGVAPPDPDSPNCFYFFPPVRDYLFSCITGRVEKTESDWCERWVIETYLRNRVPVPECLSLCCGFGHVERRLAALGVFLHCTGIDISPGAIESARERAREAGYRNIDYRVADLNTLELEPERYDLIWANSALHHISNIEHLASEIHKALKPGGFLVSSEYIGPKHMRLSFRQREIINSVIHLIPPEFRVTEETYVPVFFRYPLWRRALFELYRLLTFQPGGIQDSDSLNPRPHWPRYMNWLLCLFGRIRRAIPVRKKRGFQFGKLWDEPSRLIELTDPSESISSDKVIPVLKDTFKDIDIRYFNGSILLYALDQKFFKNFDSGSKRDRALMDLLINIEKTMIDIGELSSDHALIVAKK